MASIVSAGTTSATALNMSADTTGILQLASNNGTVGLTLNTSQNIGIGTASPSFGLSVEKDNGSGYVALFRKSVSDVALTIQTTGSITQIQGLNSSLSAVNDIAMQVSGGGVGVGTASPVSQMHLYKASGNVFYTTQSGSSYGYFINDGTSAIIGSNFGGTGTKFKMALAAPDNAVVIDSGGNFIVNTTAPAQTASTNNVLTLKSAGVAAVWGVGPTTSFGTFYISNVGTGVALSQGSTSWGTVSDERLKDIIEPITDATSKVSSLRSVIGKYKTDADDKRRSFLIAQDVQAVLPEAIDVGEDEDQMLSVKYTEVIPLLVAAINELNAKVTALENK